MQVYLIELLKEFPTLDKLYDNMCVLLGKELKAIGLIPKSADNHAVMKVSYYYFFIAKFNFDSIRRLFTIFVPITYHIIWAWTCTILV